VGLAMIKDRPLTNTEIVARYIKKLRKNKRAYVRYRRICNQWTRNWKKNPTNRNKQRASANASNLRLKIRILTHYGKRKRLMCSWSGCGVGDIDCLTLDHVKDNGKQHRESGYEGGIGGYRQLERAGYPKGFQTLCGNHQLKKENLRRRRDREQ
jgi:hypothetical protein